MTCTNCSGTLEADDSKSVLFCPYCGEKTLLIDDKVVKIAEIEADVKKEEIKAKVKLAIVSVWRFIVKTIGAMHDKWHETRQKKIQLKQDKINVKRLEKEVKRQEIKSNERIEVAKSKRGIIKTFFDYLGETEETNQKRLEVEKERAKHQPFYDTVLFITVLIVVGIIFYLLFTKTDVKDNFKFLEEWLKWG